MNRYLSYTTASLFGGILLLLLGMLLIFNEPTPITDTQDTEETQITSLDLSEPSQDVYPVQLPANAINTNDNQQNQTSTPPAPIKPVQVNSGTKTDPEEIQAMAQTIASRLNAFQERTADQPAVRLGATRGRGQRVPNPEQQHAIDQLLLTLGQDAELHVDNYSRTLRYLRGDLAELLEDSPDYHAAHSNRAYPRMASALMREIKTVMNIQDPDQEFIVQDISHDELDMVHLKLQQTYQGVPVYGSQVGVYFDANHTPIQISGLYTPSPIHITDVEPRISEKIAIANAKAAISMRGDGLTPTYAQPMIYWNFNHASVLTYQVELTPSFHEHWAVFVSAHDGTIIHKTQMVCTLEATGQSSDLFGNTRTVHSWQDNDVFYMYDTTRPFYDRSSSPPNLRQTKGAIVIMDARDQVIDRGEIQIFTVASENPNSWDPTAVSVHANFGVVEEYFRNTFGRMSIDDKGMNITGIIHARFSTPDGSVYSDNAFWNPGAQMMVFGDGDRDFSNLPASLDVAGHELTHGVINHTADLIYENQPGALNEHIADFFGAMIDRESWLMGNGVTVGKDGLRDMSNPGNPNVLTPQPAIMSQFRNLPNTPEGDNGGVHINSGIPNYMSYLLAEGPNGIGRDSAEQIIYRALTRYLTQRSQFIDYRRACVSAASDLFGADSAEVTAVNQAFDQVEIFEGTGGETPAPSPGTQTQGADLFAFLVADLSAGFTPDGDYFYIFAIGDGQQQPVLAGGHYASVTRPAISGDGSYALYVDTFNNLWATNFMEEEIIWDGGDVRTIAMSKNERFLAFTTTDYDNAIYVIDFAAPEEQSIRIAELVIPDTSGNYLPLDYADVLTFNFRGDELLYDAVVTQRLDSGELYPNWGIFSLRMADFVSRQVSAQTFGEQLGNQAMANTSDHNFLTDYIAMSGSEALVETLSFDFLQRQVGVLDSEQFSNVSSIDDLIPFLAQPSFSGDDSKILTRVFDPDNGLFGLLERPLTSDKLQIDESRDGRYLFVDSAPIWYPYGFRQGAYTDFKGEIAAPNSIDFGETPLQTQLTAGVAIENRGNADLQIIGITIEGTDQQSFRHNGANQTVAPGGQMEFEVVFSPQRDGSNNAALAIQSTDPDNPRISISMSGVGTQTVVTPTVTPSPTPQPQPTDIPVVPTLVLPTPTPITEPTATPVPPSMVEPIQVYEFDQMSLAANGWNVIPGGFTGASPGRISANSFVGQLIPSSQDRVGISVSVNPDEVAFMFANTPVETQGLPILMRMPIRASSAGAAVALAGLKGDMTTNEDVDGSIAVHIPAGAAASVEVERTLVLVYEPDESNLVTPVIQVASTDDFGEIVIFIDRLEVYRLHLSTQYPGNLFASGDGDGNAMAAARMYEFDQFNLSANGWAEIPGGFSGANPGSVVSNSFIGLQIPSSQDQVGISITVEPDEVAFIHAAEPYNSGGQPVLIRMAARSNSPDAAIALAVLRGNMSTGESVDGSIAVHIPATADSFVTQERRLTLVYEPDSGELITPAIQVAATGQEGNVTVMIDRLEIIPLSPDANYLGEVFTSSN